MGRIGHTPSFWTAGRDDIIVRLWHNESLSIEDIAAQVGAGRDRVYKRATEYLGLGPRKRKSWNPNLVHDTELSIEQAQEQDLAFRAAMNRAIAHGLERVEAGVCTTPGTKNPRIARVGEPLHSPTGSSAASCVDY